MDKKISWAILVVIIIAIYFIFFKEEKWIGFYYPDENDLTINTQSPVLKSIGDCRDWAEEQSYIYNPSGYGYDYECGKNCKIKSGSDLYICEETIR